MNCPKCGTVLADGSPFCSTCGTNLTGMPAQMGGMPGMNPGMPGMPGMPGPYGMPGMPMMQATRTSGMAIAGFVLAFFCSLLGLIFSIIGYNECKKSGGMVKGEGLALAGIIISILGMLLGVIMVAGGNSHHY
jgi:hypothetical protein